MQILAYTLIFLLHCKPLDICYLYVQNVVILAAEWFYMYFSVPIIVVFKYFIIQSRV